MVTMTVTHREKPADVPEMSEEDLKILGDIQPVPFGAEMRKQFAFDDNFRSMNHGKYTYLTANRHH